MEEITVKVDEEAARIYREASPELRAKLDTLISWQLLKAGKKRRPLRDLMDLISTRAQNRGLTEE
jgi:hypothetical protein